MMVGARDDQVLGRGGLAGPTGRTSAVLRLLALGLAALAVALAGEPAHPNVLALGAAYGLFTLFLWLSSPRLKWAGHAYLVTVADATAVTALMAQAPTAAPPVWPLYLLPVAAAALTGRAPALLAGNLSVAGYLGAVWLSTGDLPPASLWSAGMLAAGALAVGMLGTHWPLAAQALARTRAVARETLHFERALRRTATQLAATLERSHVEQVVIKTARSTLRVDACLVEAPPASAGMSDEEVAALGLQALPPDQRPVSLGRDVPLLVTRVRDDLALVVWRSKPGFRPSEGIWLNELASVGRAALERCAEHQRLRQAEQCWRDSVEAAPAPIALWDAQGALVLANAAYRALGLGDHPCPEVDGEEGLEEEVVVGDPPRVFMATARPVAGGQYVLSLYREITRERQALRAKDELIAVVGHELRTPLTSIHGYSQMMARQLSVVQEQVGQLNRLIGDLVDVARPEEGLPLVRECVDLAEVARAAAHRFEARYPSRMLRLDLAETAPTEGDPSRLGQVLDNLLDNAAKYAPDDQEVVLLVAQRGDEVLLGVRDRGVGIEPRHLPHVFDRFYRVADPAGAKVEGSGLGLSIVRDLVAAHGGRVWAESAGHGHGSTFWVALPVRHPRDAHLRTAGRS